MTRPYRRSDDPLTYLRRQRIIVPGSPEEAAARRWRAQHERARRPAPLDWRGGEAFEYKLDAGIAFAAAAAAVGPAALPILAGFLLDDDRDEALLKLDPPARLDRLAGQYDLGAGRTGRTACLAIVRLALCALKNHYFSPRNQNSPRIENGPVCEN